MRRRNYVRAFMRWIALFLLLVFNVFALWETSNYFLITIADLPIQGTTLSSYSPEVIAQALGHAKHDGTEEMQNYLLRGVMWPIGAMVVNFVAAVIAIFSGRRAQ